MAAGPQGSKGRKAAGQQFAVAWMLFDLDCHFG